MIVLKANELRKDLKKYLDIALTGESIYIDRAGVRYVLFRHGYSAGMQEVVDSIESFAPKTEISGKVAAKKLDDELLERMTTKICKHGAHPYYCKFAKPGKPCK